MASPLFSGRSWVSIFDHVGRTSFYVGRQWLRSHHVQQVSGLDDAILLAPAVDGGLKMVSWNEFGEANMAQVDQALHAGGREDEVPELLLLSLEHAQNPELLNGITISDVQRRRQQLHDARREMVARHYQPRHPELFRDDGATRGLQGRVRRALRGDIPWCDVVEPLTGTGARAWRVSPPPARASRPHTGALPAGLARVNLMTLSWCSLFLSELEAFQASGLPMVPPNTMNRGGLVLGEAGFDRPLSALLRDFIRPAASAMYSPEFVERIRDHYRCAARCRRRQHSSLTARGRATRSFVVRYDESAGRDLALHYDESDVTLNLCLGGSFHGGALSFRGLRDPACAALLDDPAMASAASADGLPEDSWERSLELAHAPGVAFIHLGEHFHEALSTTGTRYNLIMWCRSEEGTL